MGNNTRTNNRAALDAGQEVAERARQVAEF